MSYGKEEAQLAIDSDSEYLYYSDPLTLPKLKPRFYDIPASLINESGENTIAIVIKNYYQKAFSIIVDLVPDSTGLGAALDKNFFSLMPGEDIALRKLNENVLIFPLRSGFGVGTWE